MTMGEKIIDNSSEYMLQLSQTWQKILKLFPAEQGNRLQIDGIIDDKKWNSPQNKYRVLFFLKESYRRSDGTKNLYLYPLINILKLKGETAGGTFLVANKWMHAITDALSENEKFDISYAALMNVSKKGFIDRTQTAAKTLKDAIADGNYKTLLKQQLQEISPKIIVCGNTLPYLLEILQTEESHKDFHKYRIAYSELGNRKEERKIGRSPSFQGKTSLELFLYKNYIIFSAYHPSARPSLGYYTAAEDFFNIIQATRSDLINVLSD